MTMRRVTIGDGSYHQLTSERFSLAANVERSPQVLGRPFDMHCCQYALLSICLIPHGSSVRASVVARI